MSDQSTVAAPDAPIFIIGPARSGTTLVERILNRHSRIVVPPETGYLYFLDRVGALGEHPASKADLTRILSAYEQENRFAYLGIDSDADRAALLAGATSYEDIFSNLMGQFLLRHEKARWGEKTPIHLRYVAHIRRAFPTAQLVMVVRDGRAAIASQLRHPVWDWDLFSAARRWGKDARFMLAAQRSVDAGHLFVLRFEDLVADPEPVIRDLCRYLGESFEPTMIEPGSAAGPAKPAQPAQPSSDAYYDRPWMQKSTGAIDASRAGAWQDDFRAVEIKLMESIMGSELSELGYPLTHPHAPAWPLYYGLGKLRNTFRRLRNAARRLLRQSPGG